MDDAEPLTPRPRPADRAYDVVRQGILDGSLAPGTHLREEQIATMADASRTPVREALRRLVGEGLVMLGPNRRTYVADFGRDEAEAVFEIRARLEAYAAERAAPRISPAQLAALEGIADAIEALGAQLNQASVTRFMDLNAQFHAVIIAAAGTRQLGTALAAASAVPLVLLKHYVWEASVNIAQSNAHHRELIEAFRRGDSRWAGACMMAHIYSTRPAASQP